MSLFKIKQIWSTTCEGDEYFDQNSLIVTKLNSDFDYIVTASHSGVLRIFSPKLEANDEGQLQGFNPNDVVLEKIFDTPILQVGSGKLVSGYHSIHLAVLHPLLLSVYMLIIKSGLTEHGNQNYLQLIYEHKLKKSAANFIIGPFGGTQNRDFICVQSLDGLLTFFEQESQISYINLPEFLLPAPLAYVSLTDSFITCNCEWSLVSYKYKTLLDEANEAINSDPLYATPKILPDWKYDLGEGIIDIIPVDDTINNETWIMVLGERHLFSLNKNGTIRFMKKFDYSPLCFYVYNLDSSIFSLLVSETNQLLIYKNTTLKWSAHLDYLPVSLRRGFFKNIKGALVLLMEEGRLDCCYLGTEPSLFVAPPLNLPDIDFKQAEKELDELEKIMKHFNNNDLTMQNKIDNELYINVKIDSSMEVCTYQSNIENASSNYMCSIQIDLFPQVVFEEVQVSIFVHAPLKVMPNYIFYSNLSENKSIISHAFLDKNYEVPTLSVDIIVTLITNTGMPYILTRTTFLPLTLIMENAIAEKENKHKLTLLINNAMPVGLNLLFSEYSSDDATSNLIGFKSNNETISTILLAKSSNKYRLQSNNLTSLSVLVEQLILRLKTHYNNNNNIDCVISFNSVLPINEILGCANEHFKVKQDVNELQSNIAQLTAQYRLIQKRLMVIYKSTDTKDLKSLQLLLNENYSDLLNVTERLEQQHENLFKCQIQLSCIICLVKQLVNLSGLSADLMNILNSVFCLTIQDLEDQSWEDVIDASFCFLLRTTLAKTEKDKLRAMQTGFDEVKDMSKFEKHFSQVLDRLTKSPAYSERIDEEDSKNIDNEPEKQNQEDIQFAKPIGSQYGESSARLLSAGKTLLNRRYAISTNDDPDISEK